MGRHSDPEAPICGAPTEACDDRTELCERTVSFPEEQCAQHRSVPNRVWAMDLSPGPDYVASFERHRRRLREFAIDPWIESAQLLAWLADTAGRP